MANGFLQSLDTKPSFPALAARFWSAPLPADSTAVLRPLNGSSNRNKTRAKCRPNCLRPAMLSRSRCSRPPSATRGLIPGVPRPPAPPAAGGAAGHDHQRARRGFRDASALLQNRRSTVIPSANRCATPAASRFAQTKGDQPLFPVRGSEKAHAWPDGSPPAAAPTAPGMRPAALPDLAIQQRPRLPPPTVSALASTSFRLPTRRCNWPVDERLETGPRHRGPPGCRWDPPLPGIPRAAGARARESAAALSSSAPGTVCKECAYPLNTPCCRPAP